MSRTQPDMRGLNLKYSREATGGRPSASKPRSLEDDGARDQQQGVRTKDVRNERRRSSRSRSPRSPRGFTEVCRLRQLLPTNGPRSVVIIRANEDRRKSPGSAVVMGLTRYPGPGEREGSTDGVVGSPDRRCVTVRRACGLILDGHRPFVRRGCLPRNGVRWIPSRHHLWKILLCLGTHALVQGGSGYKAGGPRPWQTPEPLVLDRLAGKVRLRRRRPLSVTASGNAMEFLEGATAARSWQTFLGGEMAWIGYCARCASHCVSLSEGGKGPVRVEGQSPGPRQGGGGRRDLVVGRGWFHRFSASFQATRKGKPSPRLRRKRQRVGVRVRHYPLSKAFLRGSDNNNNNNNNNNDTYLTLPTYPHHAPRLQQSKPLLLVQS